MQYKTNLIVIDQFNNPLQKNKQALSLLMVFKDNKTIFWKKSNLS